MRTATLLVSVALMASISPAAQAQSAQGSLKSLEPAVAASIPCVDTTVRSVTPRLTSDTPNEHFTRQDFSGSGVAVTFNTKIGQPSGVIWAEVVHYQEEPGNTVMMNEHPGDRVRVCFLESPAADEGCDPKTDLRGRKFSVYDYKQHASYSGINSEHGCGGA